MILNEMKKLNDYILFNFLAKDKENAEEIISAGEGYIVPGIVSSDFTAIEEAAKTVEEIKEVAPLVSIGLGDGGNPANWEKVLGIAAKSQPGHINQPFEKSSYVRGVLYGMGQKQMVNGLVAPTGRIGYVKAGGVEMAAEELVELAAAMGIPSIKFMPLKGTIHLEELTYLTKAAAQKGIMAIEPAGGISESNITEIIAAVKDTGIPLFMPHIFGSTIDKHTGRTLAEEVAKIVKKAKGGLS
ncbi:KDGP aldolase family protein [Bacillus infantis]|nr:MULTISPECIES: KDGP aldolase [Bacillus]MCA1035912.1 KDGP aldolase family protein [Bacillus infantis]